MSSIIPQKFSGLRFKLLSALGAAFLVLFVGQFSAARVIFLNSYVKLSQARAIHNADRVKNALNQKLSQININAGDWAEWDDTYKFVLDGNAAYRKSNLVDESFIDLDLNAIAIANSSGTIIFGSAFDLQNQKRQEIPPQLTALISQKPSSLLRHSQKDKSLKGLIVVDNQPMLLSARAILTSEEKEPVRGTLFMGRFLDRSGIEEISKVTQVSFQLYLESDSNQPDDVKSVRSQLSLNEPVVRTLRDNTIVSYILIADIFGRPAAIARSQIDPNTYSQIKNTYIYYFWTTLVIGVMVCGLSWILLEKLILSRLGQLAYNVGHIGSTGNLSGRVILPGHDELSSLANTLNSTLEQLQQSQLALYESQERYAVAVAGANDGLWDWNLKFDQIYFSPRWKAILGYQESEIEDCLEAWFERVSPYDIEVLKWALQSHLAGQTPHFEYEYQMRHKDGTYRWVSCRGLAVRDERGKPHRIAGSLGDITERKLAEADLAKRTLELERSNRELEQFAYIASHDLQEPLRKIQSFSDRLQSKCASQLHDRDRDYLDRIHKSAKRMQTLIQDLLSFSRITTKAAPFVMVDLKTIILDVIDDLEIRIEQVRGCVEIGELFTIEADPLQMRQLFQNLLGNALKFHQPNKPPIVKIVGEIKGNNRCQISVTDNGIGFEQKYSDRIFQAFQRLHGRQQYEGTGIGLAICAKIVSRHNGAISCQSSPGQGATFLITLPLHQ
ncbi:MAG: PAS domain-containing protein [Hydrococcus sp. RU_2_2]|nr:PAS domain-containing protein [Hydrococcus sp. RU_2_2]